MGKLTMLTSSNIVYLEEGYGLAIYFNLLDNTIMIESSNGLYKYSMENLPVSYGQFLLYAWYQVILTMNGYPVEKILEIYNSYLRYKSSCEDYNNKRDSRVLPDINYYFSDKSENSELLNLVVVSTLIENPISLLLNIEDMKIHIDYNSKELVYSLDYLPQKYFKYLQPEVFDILESYIGKFIIKGGLSLRYNIILDNWKSLRAKVVSSR